MTVRVAPLSGAALAGALDDVARLRIEVFRAWPYIYDGDAAYEAQYLAPYLSSAKALVVGAWDGDTLVGASTGTPMEDHADAFGAPFAAQGYDPTALFYCAESVLLPRYRGQGIGKVFFAVREAHARALGRTKSCFCAVQRPADHPACPADYQPLDPFWRSLGYAPVDGITAQFAWKDVGDSGETEKPMQFWMKDL